MNMTYLSYMLLLSILLRHRLPWFLGPRHHVLGSRDIAGRPPTGQKTDRSTQQVQQWDFPDACSTQGGFQASLVRTRFFFTTVQRGALLLFVCRNLPLAISLTGCDGFSCATSPGLGRFWRGSEGSVDCDLGRR